jgi:hypothetical protein
MDQLGGHDHHALDQNPQWVGVAGQPIEDLGHVPLSRPLHQRFIGQESVTAEPLTV